MSTVKISDENKELIDDIADQLNTSIKEVVDMIFKWFFSVASNIDDLDVAEDVDEEEEE